MTRRRVVLVPHFRAMGADNAVLTAHLAGALPEALHEIGRMVVD